MKDKEKQYISMKEMLTKRSFETITNCNCRQYKEGAFVDLLNQEIEELQREKQIDLMIECMFDYARTQVDIKTATEDSRFINEYKDTLRNYANFLYDNNYRKIPENAVVLTREEYEVLKVNAKEKHWLETCIAVWENAKIDTRKETVIDILLELDLFLKGTTLRKGYEFKKLNEKLKEIAEKYGVEVEE